MIININFTYIKYINDYKLEWLRGNIKRKRKKVVEKNLEGKKRRRWRWLPKLIDTIKLIGLKKRKSSIRIVIISLSLKTA